MRRDQKCVPDYIPHPPGPGPNVNNVKTTMQQGLQSYHAEQMLNLLEDLYYHQDCHAKGDPYETAFRLGQRDVISFMREFKPPLDREFRAGETQPEPEPEPEDKLMP